MRYATLRLGAETGTDVEEVIPKRHRDDPSLRSRRMVDSLCDDAILDGEIRVPDTAGDMHASVDFRARQIRVWTELAAPDDRGGRARVTWLTRQLDTAPAETLLTAWPNCCSANSVIIL